MGEGNWGRGKALHREEGEKKEEITVTPKLKKRSS